MKRILIALCTMTLLSTAAFADRGGQPPAGGRGMGHDGGPGGRLLVGSDGTVYVTSGTVDTATNTVTETVKAIRSTGTVAWTITLPAGSRGVELAGSNLITVSQAASSDNTTFTSTITAISTASGATVWTKTLSGRTGEVTPFANGIYVVTVTPAATTGGTATRTLTAIGSDGATLWTLTL